MPNLFNTLALVIFTLVLAGMAKSLGSPCSGFKKNPPIAPGLTTMPPLAYLLLFIRCKFSAPNFLTLLFFTTNSPGVSIAGTVSLLPLPGTTPPLAKALTGPPALKPLVTPPVSPPMKPPTPLATLIAANAVSKGITGLSESANFIKALANLSVVSAITWKVLVSVIPLTKAKNSSLTLVI